MSSFQKNLRPVLKRGILLGVFVLLALIGSGILFPTQAVHAQTASSPYKQFPTCPSSVTSSPNTPTVCTYIDGSKTTCTFNGTYTCTNPDKSVTTCVPADPTADDANVTCSVVTAGGVSAGSNTAAIPQAQQAGNGNAAACGITNPLACIPQALDSVASFLFSIAGYLLGLVGMMFNWIMILTVFQFGAYFGNSQGMLIAWGVLRDIGNILLLFGFIFMGILMILDLHGMDAKKAIPQLIIFAILLNFSLFAAEAVVDVSNVLSAAIFNQAGQCTSSNCVTPMATQGNVVSANSGISGTIITTLGLNTLFKPDAATQVAEGNYTHNALFLIGAAVFMTITMVVLLAACIMFFIRAIVLAFVLVVSPIGFAAMAIPPLKSLADRWWKTLLSQSFFAPVFLLLILVSLKIMSGVSTAGNPGSTNSFADAIANPNSSDVGIFLVFALMIGFMVAALMTAKSMGAIGADFATNITTRALRSTATGSFRMAGNIGGAAVRPVIGRTARNLGTGYDSVIGNLKNRGGITGGLAKAFDYTAGGAIAGGLTKVQTTKIGSKSFKEEQDFRKARDTHTSHAAHEVANNKIIDAGVKDGATPEQKDAMYRAIQTMSKADRTKKLNSMDSAGRQKFGEYLSTAKFKETLGDAELNSDAKAALVSGRYNAVQSALGKGEGGIEALKETVKDYNAKEYEIMAENAPQLYDALLKASDPTNGGSIVKDSVLDALQTSEVLAPSMRETTRLAKRTEKIKQAYNNVGRQAADIAQVEKLARGAGKEYATLDNDLLLKPEIAAGFSREKLIAIMAKEGSFTVPQRKQYLDTIKQELEKAEREFRALQPTDRNFEQYEKKYNEMRANYEDVGAYLQNQNAKRYWGELKTFTPNSADLGIERSFAGAPSMRNTIPSASGPRPGTTNAPPPPRPPLQDEGIQAAYNAGTAPRNPAP
jgi:hypothetical protein